MNRHPVPILLFLALALTGGCGDTSRTVSPRPVSQNNGLARAENERAYALIREGKYAEAEKRLRRAIEADVMFGPARNNLGLVYFHQGKLYEAAHEFQYAIKLMPHHPSPRNNLGLVFESAAEHIGSGKLGDAIDAYQEARRLEPDNPEFIGNLARSKIKRGDKDEATQDLLEELVFKDSRQEWRDWARMNLLRLRARPADATAPSTQRGGGGK